MKKRICVFFAYLFIMLYCIPIVPFQVKATDTDLVKSGIIEENVFSYNLSYGAMTWTFHQDNATLTFKNGICIIDGNTISFDMFAGILDKSIESDENDDFDFLERWMNNTTVDEIILSNNIRKIDTQLFSTKFFRNSSRVLMGNRIEYIGHDAFNSYTQIETLILPASLQQVGENAFSNCEHLTDVTILSNDVILDNSGIGYICGKPLNNVIIRGYQNSSAETYAKENGFTFIELTDDTQGTTTTEATTTTTMTDTIETTTTEAETITTMTDAIETTTESVTSETTTTTTVTEPEGLETTTETTTIETTITSTEATTNLSSENITTTETTTVCPSPNTTTTTSENNNDIPQTGMPCARAAEGLTVVLTVGGAIVALKSRKK